MNHRKNHRIRRSTRRLTRIERMENRQLMAGDVGEGFVTENENSVSFLGGVEVADANLSSVGNDGDGSDAPSIVLGQDGSDLIRGRRTKDASALNTFSVDPNGERVRSQHEIWGIFTLDIGTSENLDLDGGEGNDLFRLSEAEVDAFFAYSPGFLGGVRVANRLIGLDLDGGEGNDVLRGGAGNDTLLGQRGND